ncbi:hypothetical protein GGX14DRAFT_634189 [Mycena pura]|uniref:Uncharacterized protein n=1 Tax=Mycena pura TaxID=153505 RepID=A0AAD6YA16_9AGAR|nr:hypothetical protein GGX14DRAFT_634189 [Mycena pura]
MAVLVTANLVEALVEAVLYGVYGVLFITVLYLFRSRVRRPAVWVSLGLVVQFLAITGCAALTNIQHWIVMLYTTVFAFVHLGGGAAAAAFYNDISSPSFVAGIGFCGASSLVTNFLVIHRVYVIFSNSRSVTFLPFVFLMIQVVASVGLFCQYLKSDPGGQYTVIYGLSNPWVTVGLVASIVLVFCPVVGVYVAQIMFFRINVYSTAMISWRIRRVTQALRSLTDESARSDGGMPLMSILAIIAESAALQTYLHFAAQLRFYDSLNLRRTVTVGALVTYHIGFVEQVGFSGISPVIFGISTVLIHARIGLGWAYGSDADGSISNPTWASFATPTDGALELEEQRRK